MNRRSLALVAVLAPLLVLFLFVVLRSGPLAPVPVVLARVESRELRPALFALGAIEARATHRVGPTAPGRIRHLAVDVGDTVVIGQLLAEMEPLDFDSRVAAQVAAVARADVAVLAAEAAVRESSERLTFAARQAERYEQLAMAGITSREVLEARRQDHRVAEAAMAASAANVEVARRETARQRAELASSQEQRTNLRLEAPVAGLVVSRLAEPGTTVVAGSVVVEVIDPASLWVQVRFDQAGSAVLAAGLSAEVTLRSRPGVRFPGRVQRLEPLADAVTEERLGKVVFDSIPTPLPPIGELAEVTVTLPALPPRPVVPNASLQEIGGQRGVWRLVDGALRFTPVEVWAGDLDGFVQIVAGLAIGDQVVVYSSRALRATTRVKVVESLPGVPR